ncbi:basement membrane proteoglycan-like [Sitodiplosis mosellana]|uniref:basement membrane proteoglycan-like n=1 Tax=Sitodiplosis mosellana TaxID=263140 RepID=UPI00244426D4|nr:basement membrane proteoglycan-like [Sitodiplosis mosellana]
MKIILMILCFGTIFCGARMVESESTSDCNSNELRCNNGDCVPKEAGCNGEWNCEQGEDETDCEYYNYYLDHYKAKLCPDDKFRCKSGHCILKEWACDGKRDCTDGSDEEPEMCKNRPCAWDEISCGSNGECIPRTWICDGKQDCSNGFDESKCTQDEVDISFVPLNATTFKPPTADLVFDIHNIYRSDNYNLTCLISGNPMPNVTFKKLGADSFGLNVQPDGNVLRFFNTQFDNGGVYQCIAESNGGIDKANTIVNVEALEELKVEIYPHGPQIVQEGEHVLLKCRIVSGNPGATLEWSRRDQEPFSYRVEKISNGTILISNIKAAEAGEYVCKAVDGSVATMEITSIVIQPTPTVQITIFPNVQEITLTEGDPLDLFCTANGSSSVTWHTINTTTPDYSLMSYHSATLKKFTINRNDEAIYICRAENKFGYTDKRIKVLVQPKVDVINVCQTHKPCKNNGICVSHGSNFTCDCRIHYTGEICQYNDPIKFASQFRGNGYIELNRSVVAATSLGSNISLSFLLSTSEPNGLIVWYGQKKGEAYPWLWSSTGQDFVALAIVNGYLKYTVRLLGREKSNTLDVRVDDGERHVVILTRYDISVRLQLDDFRVDEEIIGSDDDVLYWPPLQLNELFIGGAPDIEEITENRYMQGFNGNIYMIEGTDGAPVNVYDNAVGGYNVAPCHNFV